MNYTKYLLVGITLGVVMIKSEAVSWYRIYEMFNFQSFHMYGIIMVAIGTGLIGLKIIKRKEIKDIRKKPIVITNKEKGLARYSIGGILFGLGWGLVGTCPGPIFTLIGAGFGSVLIIFFGAMLGTFLYGLLKDRLPN